MAKDGDSRRSQRISPNTLGILIARARRELKNQISSRLEAIGESFWDYQILARLAQSGSFSQNHLAADTAHHPAMISRLLADLEERGLIRRARDPEDRRRVRVEITLAGRKVYERSNPVVVEGAGAFIAPLGEDERRVLHALLTKVVGREESLLSPTSRSPLARERSRAPGAKRRPAAGKSS